MKFCTAVSLILSCAAGGAMLAAEPKENSVVIVDPAKGEQEGRELSARLRELRPAENFTNSGTLVLRDAKGRRRQLPVVIATSVASDQWRTTYDITQATQPVSLTVRRSVSGPASYQLTPATETSGSTPFAGTDFWLVDLGLDFIHWPAQRVLKHEMRRSEWCWVLESTNPQPATGGYSRVVSWVHTDSGGIVHADAYDARGKLLKVFEPKSFEKINGKWEVRELEIRNEQTDTRTTLRFDLEKK